MTGDELRAEFDAVVLTIGSRVPRDLPVPGRELQGIHPAMDYLYVRNRWVATQLGPEPTVTAPEHDVITAAGKHVVVVGGGDTGADCVGQLDPRGRALGHAARAAARAAASAAPTTARRGRCGRRSSASPTRWRRPRAWARASRTSRSSRRTSAARTVTSPPSTSRRPSRRRRSRPVAGTERELKADLVLLAMGFLHPAAGGDRRAARLRARPARQRARRDVRDVGPGRVRRRRRPPRTVADRLGDQRGPPVRADGRPPSGGRRREVDACVTFSLGSPERPARPAVQPERKKPVR